MNSYKQLEHRWIFEERSTDYATKVIYVETNVSTTGGSATFWLHSFSAVSSTAGNTPIILEISFIIANV